MVYKGTLLCSSTRQQKSLLEKRMCKNKEKITTSADYLVMYTSQVNHSASLRWDVVFIAVFPELHILR